MSRVGKKEIQVPSGVKVALEGRTVKVNGLGGALQLELMPEVNIEITDSVVKVLRVDDSRAARSLHGLMRSLVANMIKGVSDGFEKKLEIVGVGYKAGVNGNIVNLTLGYSHPLDYKLPDGIKVTIDKQTSISIKGADKQVVGQVAADIRSMRMPEPYKGKGIKYADEVIRKKAGKAGKAAGGGV